MMQCALNHRKTNNLYSMKTEILIVSSFPSSLTDNVPLFFIANKNEISTLEYLSVVQIFILEVNFL